MNVTRIVDGFEIALKKSKDRPQEKKGKEKITYIKKKTENKDSYFRISS